MAARKSVWHVHAEEAEADLTGIDSDLAVMWGFARLRPLRPCLLLDGFLILLFSESGPQPLFLLPTE